MRAHDPYAPANASFELPDTLAERLRELGADDYHLARMQDQLKELPARTRRIVVERIGELPDEILQMIVDEADEQELGEAIAAWRAEQEGGVPDDSDPLVPLPEWMVEGLSAAGFEAHEFESLTVRWTQGSDEDRENATTYAEDFDPEEWAEFVTGWRLLTGALADLPEGDSSDEDPTAEQALLDAFDTWLQAGTTANGYVPGASGGQESPLSGPESASNAENGAAQPADQAGPQEAAQDAADGDGSGDGDRGDTVTASPWPDLPAEPPETGVRVEVSVDVERDEDGNGVLGYGFTVDVPDAADQAVEWIGNEYGYPGDTARAVLTAELQRPPSKRRVTVMEAVTAALGEAEVQERTQRADAPTELG